MSRCFPYPPPGYSTNSNRDEALIESIKLQREREKKSKAERKKERTREKKEKRRENKVNVKQNVSEFGHGEKRKLNDEKTLKWEKDRLDLKGGYIQKGKEKEVEQLEKSGLTEEHEQPACPQNPCYSSDSIQNSNKRRRQASHATGIRTRGNIIRIRLPSQKHIESDVAVSEERIGSTGKRNSEIGHGPSPPEFCSTSTENDASVRGLCPRLDKEQSCSTSGGIGIFARDNSVTTTGSKSVENGIRIVASLYKDLVENWVPLPPHTKGEQTDLDQLEWLFQREHQDKERSKASGDGLCTGGSTLWPRRAQYLPEADIWALPFTVPF